MKYQTFQPHPDLSSFVKCYWTLEVPAEASPQKQRIVPDGCIEMAFILGDDIKRYTSDNEFILQPRAMVLGQTIEPMYIEPTGYVNTFAVRFYPYGFANFVAASIKSLVNKETPITELFGEAPAKELEQDIINASGTEDRIIIIEEFLVRKVSAQENINAIVKSTIDAIYSSKGATSINDILRKNPAGRRQLERNFLKQIGISPKQLGKVIRLQAALKLLLNCEAENLTGIAYESDYYDQAHFIKDFREFTGVTPGEFLNDGGMALSALFYSED